MGIINKRRPRTIKPQQDRLEADDRYAFVAEIPVGRPAQPLWKLEFVVDNEPQADGDRLRVRAHVQTNLASALRPALQSPPSSRGDAHALGHDGSIGSTRGLAERAGHAATTLARRALNVPLLRRVAEPLLQLDFNTWIDIQASTASLNAGSRALLPQAERLASLGIHPRAAGETPMAETWAGEAPDGFAQVSVLQLDRRHLPATALRWLGERPFGLAATIVNAVQQKKATKPGGL